MLQTIATIIALVIGLVAFIFTAVIFYKIFLSNRPKKEKKVKASRKETKLQSKKKTESQDSIASDNEPEIKLFAPEKSKVTGFELDDD